MSLGCSNTPPPNPFITPAYLSELHSMPIDEAELYCQFCYKHTIRWIGCYGNGEIMLPLWHEEKRQADRAVTKLIVSLF